MKAEVVREEGRPRTPFVKKHLGETAVEPFVITLGLGLDKSVYTWLAEAWAGKQKARDGAIIRPTRTSRPSSAGSSRRR